MALTPKRKNKPPLWAMKLCCSHEILTPGATLATVTGSVRLMGTEELLAPCGGLSLRLASGNCASLLSVTAAALVARSTHDDR